MFGYYNTQCLYVVAELNIADYLQDDQKHISDIARYAEVDEGKLYRIMRFLSSKNLFNEYQNKIFGLNRESKCLVSTDKSSMKDFVTFHAMYFYQSAKKILEGIKTDQIPFNIEFEQPFWTFLEEDQHAGTMFNRSMKNASDAQAKIIANIYDFSSYKKIVDLGGGLGSLLANILHKYRNCSGINFDLATMHDDAELYFKKQNLSDRLKYISGSFFETIPEGADLYIMKAILHGKKDDISKTILRKCKTAMPNHARLLIIDRIISKDEYYVDACTNDINMLNVSGGKDRTLNEFKHLLSDVDLHINSTYRVSQSLFIIQAIKTNL